MSRYLITGVSRGIGAETARQLLVAGHDVYGIVRPGSAEPDGLAGLGFADLAAVDNIAGALGSFAADLGHLDGLVHSAGIARGDTLGTTTADDFTRQFALNVTAIAELDKLFLPLLRSGGGTAVYLNSRSGLDARSPLGAYAASKHALKGYTDSIRLEEPKVRICSIYPGRVATDMQREINATEGTDFDTQTYLRPETVAGAIVTMLMLPADGVITDLVLAVR